jgi:hypothetical protein
MGGGSSNAQTIKGGGKKDTDEAVDRSQRALAIETQSCHAVRRDGWLLNTTASNSAIRRKIFVTFCEDSSNHT